MGDDLVSLTWRFVRGEASLADLRAQIVPRIHEIDGSGLADELRACRSWAGTEDELRSHLRLYVIRQAAEDSFRDHRGSYLYLKDR
jgi:hypothetical protein